MEKPLVSIIVPVYNVEKYLCRCLDSIKNQTYNNIEVLLVDDGSTDNSGTICDTYTQSDSRFETFHIPNGGVSRARNYALDRMKGAYCTFIDSDDIVSEYFVEHEVESVLNKKEDIVLLSQFIFIHYSNANQCNQLFDHKQGESIIINTYSYDFINEKFPLTVVGSLFCSELVRDIRFDEELFRGEDTLFMSKVLNKVGEAVIITENMYAYIQYPDSLSHGKYSYSKFTELIAWERICKLFTNRNSMSYISCRAAFAYRCILRIDDMVENSSDNYEYIEYAKKYSRKNAFYVLLSTLNLRKKIKLSIKCYLPEIQVYLCKKRRDFK